MSKESGALLLGSSLRGFKWDIPNDFPFSGSTWASYPSRQTTTDLFSRPHRSSIGAQNQVTINSDIAIVAIMLAEKTCLDSYRKGTGVVRVQDSVYAAEYHCSDGQTTLFAVYNSETGSLSGGRMIGALGAGTAYSPLEAFSAKKKQEIVPELLCIMAAMLNDPSNNEFVEDIKTLSRLVATTPDSYEVISALYRISDSVYFSLKENLVQLNIPRDGNIRKIDLSSIENGALSGEVIVGNPIYLNGTQPDKNSRARKNGKITVKTCQERPDVMAYVAKHCNWTEEEKKLIPKFDGNMPVPVEVEQCLTAIIGSSECKRPIVQLGWRGTSAFGKSTGVEILCAILNKPLLRFTCSSTTERQDFLTQIMPDTSGSHAAKATVTFEEISLDPEGAYAMLTGKVSPGITCEEVFQEAVRRMAAGNSSTPRYVMQESAYIKALKNGYMVEVQESSRIRDAGVLPGLNEYDRPGALIPQEDGTYARRHPDAIVFFTDNVGYRSCNDLDPSVLRRIAFFIDSNELPKEKVLARIKINTDSKELRTVTGDKKLVGKMYDIWKKVGDYCKDNDLSAAGGCVTIEELERWIQMTAILGLNQIRTACRYCVINKATSDADEQQIIESTIVATELASIGF